MECRYSDTDIPCGVTADTGFGKGSGIYGGRYGMGILLEDNVPDDKPDSENPVMSIVLAQSRGLRYGLSAAMAWIYFLIVAVALAIIVAIVSKFVFYEND